MGSVLNVIQHNMLSMFSDRQLGITTNNKAKSTEKLSSGYRINRAADDAAGLSISEKMRKLIRGLDQGLENTQDGISFLQIADGAMEEAHSMIHRMEELAVKAANGTNSDSDRAAINEEMKALKTEINRIGITSKFNEEQIFEQKLNPPAFSITGNYFTMEDINIFNSSYDDLTGKATYGGIIYNGERISWDRIDANMVKIDDQGNQTFVGGEYSFTTSDGASYKLTCNDGDEVPRIMRREQFSGDIDNIYVAGKRYSWSDFVDADGEKLDYDTMHDGKWTLNGNKNVAIELNVKQDPWNYADMGDLKEAIAAGLIKDPDFFWKETWKKSVKTVAMETTGEKDVNITSRSHMTDIRENLSNNGRIEYRVRAGKEDNGADPQKTSDYSKNGVWLEEYKLMPRYDDEGAAIVDTDGNPVMENRWVMVDGSLQSWSTVGLQDADGDLWNSGKDIRNAVETPVTYNYEDGSGTTVGFNFILDADVTSFDSVIDGLDKAMAYSKSMSNSYEGKLYQSEDSNVTSATVRFSAGKTSLVTIDEEYGFQRNYGEQTVNSVASGTGEISGNNVTVSMNRAGGNSSTAVVYTGDISANKSALASNAMDYAQYVETAKISLALAGEDPQNSELSVVTRSINKVVGEENITMTGFLTEEFTITSDMTISDGLNAIGGVAGKANSTYGCAHIDFKDVSNIMDLNGTGFDTTCGFCSNHYSVLFTEDKNNEFDTLLDKNNKALKYQLDSSGKTSEFRGHFLMKIDLNSLITAGYTKDNLAEGVVKVLSGSKGYIENTHATEEDGLDFHYTQYAADKSVLYIYSNQNSSSAISTLKMAAIFSTKPYEEFFPDTDGSYSFNLADDKNRSMNLSYDYDFSDLKDDIVVTMKKEDAVSTVQDAINALASDPEHKLYQKIDNGDGTFYYTEYVPYGDPEDNVELYSVSVEYKTNTSDTPSTYSSVNDMLNAYAENAVSEMLTNSTVNFNATDYTKLKWACEERPNVALAAEFETTIYSSGNTTGNVRIQHSDQVRDYTNIPKFGLNTFVLGIFRADCSTMEKATRTIDMTKKALQAVSYRRSLYGAYQNRLEATYRNHDNVRENTAAAESLIRDTNMNDEMVRFSNLNILQQAGQSMLTQANQSRDYILSLLQ